MSDNLLVSSLLSSARGYPFYFLPVFPSSFHLQDQQHFLKLSCVILIGGLDEPEVTLGCVRKDLGKLCCVINGFGFRAPLSSRLTFSLIYEIFEESWTLHIGDAYMELV